MASLPRIAAVAAVAATGISTVALAATPPALHIVRDRPLTLHGTAFRPGEAIRVTVWMGEGRWSRQVQVGSAGAFTVRFGGVTLDYCATPLSIAARRATGVVHAKVPNRDCAAP